MAEINWTSFNFADGERKLVSEFHVEYISQKITKNQFNFNFYKI